MKSRLNTLSAALLILLSVLIAPACSSLPIGRGVDPSVIIVRNSTGADLAEATLSEASGGSRAARYGSISPIPRGASQVFVRPNNPLQLPRNVILEWINDQGSRYSLELSLKQVLQTHAGEKGGTLVFDILPQGDAAVYLEQAEVSAAHELENIEWRLVEVEGMAISPPVGEKWPFLRFDPVKKQAAGYAGCNNFFAVYTREGSSLSFGTIGATRRACEGPQEGIERDFLKALAATRSWQIRDNALLLSADKVLARFKRADGKSH